MTGTYHELNPVYRQQYNDYSVMQEMSFESEEGLQPELAFQQYTVTEANNPPPVYSSSPQLHGGQQDFAPLSNSQYSIALSTAYQDNQMNVNELSAVSNCPDLRWITTSTTDMRTQSPLNMSSPRPTPPVYPSKVSTPGQHMLQQGSIEDELSSTATISHSQLTHSFSPPNTTDISPANVRNNQTKKSSDPNVPTKPKGTPGRKRKFQDHELTPAEATRRHIRRERNKVAAAKCRNRRRELTDRLQGETDHLEDHQSMLQHEIMSLQQEKEHLEFILASHNPNCKAGELVDSSPMLLREESRSLRDEGMLHAPSETIGDLNTRSDANLYFRQQQQPISPRVVGNSLPTVHNDVHCNNPNNQQVRSVNMATNISNRSKLPGTYPSMNETRFTMTLDDLSTLGNAPLNTPVCAFVTPSQNNGTYTFPNTQTLSTGTSFNINSPELNFPASQTANSPSNMASMPVSFNRFGNFQQSCSAALRRRSSSESHQSPDSVKSPKLLSL